MPKDEYPYDIPDNWKFLTIATICNIINGFTPLRTNEEFWNSPDVPWFTVEDIHKQGRFISHTQQHISYKALSKDSKRILPKNTVLLCCTASIGEYAYTNIELTTNQQFNGLIIKEELKNFISPLYLFTYVKTLKQKLIDNANSTTFKFLSVKKLGEFIIPIPPIEEQQRIVETLDRLLPLCEAL